MQSHQHQKKSSAFLRYIHNFRGIAILIVVVSHIFVYLDWENSGISQVICKTLFKDGTVYFVFIAGFLFQYLSAKYVYINYLKKKLNYVIIPYTIVSMPAVIYCILSQKIPSDAWFKHIFSSWPFSKQVIIFYLTGAHLYPLWFIPMIAIFYVISPFLILLDKNPKFYWVLFALIPISFAFPRPQINQIIQSFLYFFPVYILGMFGSHYLKDVLLQTKKYFLVLAWISLTLSCLYAYQIYYEEAFLSTHLFVNTFNREIQCFLLLYLLWEFDEQLSNRTHQILALFAEMSFGIYFVHGYIISIYFKLLAKLPTINYGLSQGNFMVLLFTFALVTFLSIVLVIIIKKCVGKKSRYVVGC